MYDLNLGKYVEEINEITDQAKQEARMEKTLKKLEETWATIVFLLQEHKGTGVHLLKMSDEEFEQLEEQQVAVNQMFSSRFLSTFEDQCVYWQTHLAGVSEVVTMLQEVQRSWTFLENLFIYSEEVKKELPKESQKFIGLDKEVKQILSEGKSVMKCIKFCNENNILKRLEASKNELDVCEKALMDFMDGKRRAFPRFYFVSTADLLDILSNGNSPSKVMVHMPKIFQAIATLELKEGGERPTATKMISCVGTETVEFSKPLPLLGKVETYLADVIDTMRATLNDSANKSVTNFRTVPKNDWLRMDPAMITLLVNIISWCENVETHLLKLKQNPQSMQQCLDNQVNALTDLIKIVQGKIDSPFRQKIMCMITLDTHSRDIILKLKEENVKTAEEFQWQSQLKAYWDTNKNDVQFRITDAKFWYGYEYLGNGPRLVVTPLTDRIYVTACQALHLQMGCAPAGPAGTGKTETTKDLASALGKAVYVFNCSDNMDYLGMGGIFKGLAASGSWGCFDEFNRLVPEVLSVCSVQFKSVTDAIKAEKTRFVL